MKTHLYSQTVPYILTPSVMVNKEMEDPRHRTSPLCNGFVSHGAHIGGPLQSTHTQKQNAKQMRPQSSCAIRHFAHTYPYAQDAVDAGNRRTQQAMVILITEETPDSQF